MVIQYVGADLVQQIKSRVAFGVPTTKCRSEQVCEL